MTPTLPQRAAAKAKVDAIRGHLGFPSQEFLETLNERLNETEKKELLSYFNSKDTLIGGSAITLAKSLYTSKARFVFELLQNVEDNEYTNAATNNDPPQVTFHIHHDRIVQECNEDGFNEANLQAICSIGKSSKTGSQSYIGEKGIGFKSVFMVAYKALIESGGFSFFFEHRPGDIGMGMIAPQWQDSTEEIDDRLTRITLFLHNKLSEKEQTEQTKLIRDQFESIHGAILLFMSKLKEIKILFYAQDGESEVVEKSIQLSTQTAYPITTITKTTTENGEPQNEVNHYFVHTKLAKDLAKSENRDYQDNDETFAQSNVTLAFPLTAKAEPLLAYQMIFAYLPTCPMGFRFLIQADFVTQANRQGVVETSDRNKSLMKAIAHTFVESVEKMLEVPSLRFKWMRYLPTETEYPWGDLWGSLVTYIEEFIRQTPVLESRSSPTELKYIEDSRRLSNLDVDSNGDPLLPDMDPEIYISSSYESDDLELLDEFGLELMSMRESIERAANDLKSDRSRIKDTQNLEWQAAFVELLLCAWDNDWTDSQSSIRQLEMFQTRSQSWKSCSEHEIFFSTIKGTSIQAPTSVGSESILLDSVDQHEKRYRLYELMGVKHLTMDRVHRTIIAHFQSSTTLPKGRASIHLKFLYKTHHLVTDGSSILDDIKVVDLNERLHNPASTNMYIFDDNDYGVRKLLMENSGPYSAPGRPANFMEPEYFKTIPEKPAEASLTWEEWLYSTCKIRRFLPLLNDEGTDLSADCKYLAEYRPDRFLGYLQSVWNFEKERCYDEADVIEKILDIEVVCSRAGHTDQEELRDAYLPLAKHLKLAKRFLTEDEYFPFLELRCPLSHDDDPEEWRLLGQDFGLGCNQEDQIDFLLSLITSVIQEYQTTGEKESNPTRVYDFYLYLHAESRQSSDRAASCEKIRQSILMETTFIPGDDDWDETRMCVWEAPNGLELLEIYALSERYSSAFDNFDTDKALMEDFFVNTLQIAKKCSWGDLVKEIKYLKTKNIATFDRLNALYEALSCLELNADEIEELRNTFNEDGLVCAVLPRKTSWYKVKRCLWSETTSIPGKFNIKNHYGDLRSFFVDTLLVQECTIDMVYDKLAGDVTKLSVKDISLTLEVFSTLLDKEGGHFDPERLVSNKIWPVTSPDNEVILCSTEKDFVIRDRQSLSDAFDSQAWFLAFQMDSARHIGTLISWAGLEARYISNAVKEICSVDIASRTPLYDMKWQISQKAHALTRIAATFDSPWLSDGPDQLYAILKEATVFETSKITAKLILNQNGIPISVDKESYLLDIPDDESELKINVTNNEVDQEGCFNSKLPRRLAQWILSEPGVPSFDNPPATMVHAIQSVLAVSRRALPTVLDELGIIDIELEDDVEEIPLAPRSPVIAHVSPPSSGDLVATPQSAEDGEFIDLGNDTHLSPNIAPTRPRSASRRRASSKTSTVSAADRRTSSVTPGIDLSASMVNAYRRLLLRVVENSHHAVIPFYGSRTDEPQRTSEGDTYNLRLYTKIERDKRVGAAGELWVYEVLSRLTPGLPDFSLSNWQSNIRGYVSSHPDYTTLQSWESRETSDIVYNDRSGAFTDMLIERGYLEASMREHSPIEYYIEVKTTTVGCNTAFYMSHYQYRRMTTYSTTDLMFPGKRKLYVIFRVYNLLADTIGLKILVDPKAMEADGSLSFSTDTWSVVINSADEE